MLVRFRPAVALLGLVALSLGAAGCGGKYDSPQACFQTLRVAAHNKDVAAVCDCLTEESQDVITGGLVANALSVRLQSAMAPDDADLAKQVTAFEPAFAKHGITDEIAQGLMPTLMTLRGAQDLPPLAKVVKDKRAFMADMFAAMEKSGIGANFGEEFYAQLAGELKDVKIEGDKATAIVVTKTGEDPLEFQKTPAGWKLHIDLNKMAPASAAPPA